MQPTPLGNARRVVSVVAALTLLGAIPAFAQSDPSITGPQPFDQCGVLVNGNGCVLLDGEYLLTNAGGYPFGATVRVVGTLDPHCINICGDISGCISGAEIYDPTVFPCGTALPNLQTDIVSGVCSGVAGGLVLGSCVGLGWSLLGRSRL